MSQNRLGTAIVVLLALGGLTFYQLSTREAEDKAAPQASVTLPKLKRDAIDELSVSGGDQPAVRLVKKGSEWRLAEPLDAKGDEDAISTALDKLVELEVTGVAATKAKNHERLEVDEKKGLRVTARGAGKTLLDGYIGSYQTGNTMFRSHGQDAVASVRGSIRYAFAKATREWRDRTINKLEMKALKEIDFASKNGNFRFAHEGDTWKQILSAGQKGIERFDEKKVPGIVSAVLDLSATDFADANVTQEQAGLTAGAATVTVTTTSEAGSQQIRFKIGGTKDKDYYLVREGVDTIFVVSSWVGDRLMPKDELFAEKKETAPGENTAPLGSRENAIQVYPTKVEHSATDPHAAAAKPAAAKTAQVKK
jgi:hypothetical protein